jgi:urate oxidase
LCSPVCWQQHKRTIINHTLTCCGGGVQVFKYQAKLLLLTSLHAGPDAAAHIVSSIDTKQSQLSALQASCSEAVLAYTQQVQGYLAELSSMQQLLTQLGQCILTEQPAMDKVRCWVSKGVMSRL